MKTTLVTLSRAVCLAFLVCCTVAAFGQGSTNAVVFKDKNLEKAVRKSVIMKKDTTEPLTENDLANLSTVQGTGMEISDLSGLEKCLSLASLDLAQNRASDLAPLKGLVKIQYLNLAGNQIEDISPISEIKALQYVELSNNRVKDLKPLSGLTNMASLYLSSNQITDIKPMLGMLRLSSLYLDDNKVKSIAGLDTLKGLYSLSLKNNGLSDIAPLEALTNLYYLFLEGNKIRDLTPLINAAKKDFEGDKRFAPFLNLFLKGNPVKGNQKSRLKDYGVRLTD
jgi:Leucine-rich repeat (LRR) protein